MFVILSHFVITILLIMMCQNHMYICYIPYDKNKKKINKKKIFENRFIYETLHFVINGKNHFSATFVGHLEFLR